MNYNDPQTYLEIIRRKAEKRRQWNFVCNTKQLFRREIERELDKVLNQPRTVR